jgi:PiT family inorganic phosphate transporter
MLTLFLCVLLVALVFEYINGFHDTANAIATVVSTKVLTPRQAVLLAAFFNLLGAFIGTAVAKNVATGYVDTADISMLTVLAGLLGAIAWNLLTWWFGIPSSSSHALIGGLCGAAIATSPKGWSVLVWDGVDKANKAVGLWPKLVKWMILSPIIGFAVGLLVMWLIQVIFRKSRPSSVNRLFGHMQLASASWMGLSHGTNDAQKTMGIIALALFTGTTSVLPHSDGARAFDSLPGWLGFLRMEHFGDIPTWIVVTCALVMAAGTAVGGWRIIKTMGHKMVKLMPVHGFAAEATAAAVIQVASSHGIPLSTTHVISTSIMGVGATRRLSAVKWGLVHRIVWAWIFTLPVTGFISFWTFRLLHAMGLH